MSPLNLLGAATACLGLAGTGVAIRAGCQVLAIPRSGHELSEWPVLIGLAFVGLVDIAMVAVGTLVFLVKL